MIPISVTILTKNSEKYLQEVLSHLTDFDEVLLYDNGSTDSTFEIASRFSNVNLVKGTFEGFGVTHNKASAAAKHDWIFSIDSDELASPALVAELKGLSLDKDTVYSFPRHNYFEGKWIRWCGWYPDRQYRLYHRGTTSFTPAEVHEAIITEGHRHVPLDAPIIHYSYASQEDFLAKMQSYSSLFAKQYAGKKKSSVPKAIAHGCAAFLKSFVLKRGFLGGPQGFMISVYNGNTAYYKYLKLREANLKLAADQNKNTCDKR
jgi:glycosyltransferase involved in cell wall biosynthesis